MIGKTFSHYKIIEKIGEGGMGIVYKALDVKLDRFVALKFLPPHLGRDDLQKQRFIHEAKAASALDHPNICTVYEIDETGAEEHASFGQIFIALAYYEGNTLQKKISRDAPMSIDEAIGIIMQIAQGLQKAHEADIVHRDVKPANIIVTTEGDVKIVDFGLAKLKGHTKLTKEESTLGTITYMSPEQTEGTEIDARTDIWSLGIIFYEMLTGKSPFDADYDQAIMYNILNAIPEPVYNLNKSVPRELNAVIQKCLEKEKGKRYQTIKDFFADLFQVINEYNYKIRMGSGDFNLAMIKERKRRLSPLLSATAILVLISVFTILFLVLPESKYTGYEKAYFESNFNDARDKSAHDRPLENVKANRYHILSTAYVNQDTMPIDVEQEYRNLLMQNPDSPQAHYYMGLMHYAAGRERSQRDSVWLLFDQAKTLGMDDIYLTLDMAAFFMRDGFTQEAFEMVNALLEKDPPNPDVLYRIGTLFYFADKDTLRARKFYERTLNLYDNHLAARIGLCQLALDNYDLNTALINLGWCENINNENYEVVRIKSEIYEREGKFAEAEDYLKKVINSFGINDIRFYKSLARLYQKLDLFEKCDELIQSATARFSSTSYFADLKKSLETRKEWLRIQQEHDSDQNLVSWSDDFDKSLEKAAREKKPVLIEFYSTQEFWSKALQERTYPDQKVQNILKSYIPLRINGEIRKDLAQKYQADYFPYLVMLNEHGEKLFTVRYWLEPPGPEELIENLSDGLTQYQRYLEGLDLENRQTTEVSNIKDALLLAKSKQMPVMAVVLSSESKWSDKLVNETLVNPMLKADLQKVILVKVNQAVNKYLIKQWDITYFPSIVFLDQKGNILYQAQGYHTPRALADLIIDLNDAMKRGQKIKDRIRWLYDLEEVQSVALLQKKDILIYCDADWCPYCGQIEKKVFSDPSFIKVVNKSFIPIEINDSRDPELIKSFGINAFPALIILDASLTELTRYLGAGEVTEVVAALNIDERKPLFSILGPDKYKLFYKYENLSEKFYERSFLRSFIRVNQKQLEIYPEHWQSYRAIGEAHLDLKNSRDAQYYFNKAIDHGAEIEETFANDIMDAYLQLDDVPGFEIWIQNTLKARKKNPDESKVLHHIAAKFHSLLKNGNPE